MGLAVAAEGVHWVAEGLGPRLYLPICVPPQPLTDAPAGGSTMTKRVKNTSVFILKMVMMTMNCFRPPYCQSKTQTLTPQHHHKISQSPPHSLPSSLHFISLFLQKYPPQKKREMKREEGFLLSAAPHPFLDREGEGEKKKRERKKKKHNLSVYYQERQTL